MSKKNSPLRMTIVFLGTIVLLIFLGNLFNAPPWWHALVVPLTFLLVMGYAFLKKS